MTNAIITNYQKQYHPAMAAKQPMTNADFMKAFYAGITFNHEGKMKGNSSFSTSVLENAICQARRKVEGSICFHCYANELLKDRDALGKKASRNLALVNTWLYPVEAFPYINCDIFRMESFGDVSNIIHAGNYYHFIIKNSHVHYAWFTKNINILNASRITYGIRKPANVKQIASSAYINRPDNYLFEAYPEDVDALFTVFTARFAIENDIRIDCLKSICVECHRCYENIPEDRHINEIIKNEQNIYIKALKAYQETGDKQKALTMIDKWHEAKAKRDAKKAEKAQSAKQ